MRAHLLLLAASAPLFFFSTLAHAENGVVVETDLPPPPPPKQQATTPDAPPPAYKRTTHGTPGAYTDETDDDEDSGMDNAPAPRHGFQMSIRTGYAIPMGNAYSNEKMSQGFGGQVPFLFDVGGKVGNYIFIGGNLGLNFGGCGDVVANDCASVSFRLGAEIIFNILPRNRVNPWVGYGIGIEASGVSANGGTESISFFGPEFAHFLGGVDFRVSKGFGVGPFADFGIGEYTKASVTQNNQTISGTLDGGKAVHEWLTLGAKFTIFP